MPPIFGMTSPCAEIAKHFGVHQEYVDHAMEWALLDAGIRTKSPGREHAERLGKLANDVPLKTRLGVAVALDQVTRDIKADAQRRREAGQ